MIINIDRLPQEGLRVKKDFEFFNSELIEEDAVFIEPVQAEVSVKRLGEELLIKGRILSVRSGLSAGRAGRKQRTAGR